MLFKLTLVTALLVLSSCHTEEENVLVLGDADFPAVLSQFNHILVEFYAPWCGHCKSLAPVYAEVATALKEQGSSIRLAKVDATENQAVAGQYGVQGYPTLYFFVDGQKISYNGPRSKEGMLTWLEKKTRDPVVSISAGEYEKLTAADSATVSIVYHGDLASSTHAETLKKIAVADEYNTYYFGQGLGQPEGTIEILRNFDTPATYPAVDDGLRNWITKNERPLVVPFDERCIGQIFEQERKALVLFNSESSSELLDLFNSVSKEYNGQPLIFTEVNGQNEHLNNFADYLKIDRTQYPIILINVSVQQKYVFDKQPTKENILEFLSNPDQYRYGLNQQVKTSGQAATDSGSDSQQQIEAENQVNDEQKDQEL